MAVVSTPLLTIGLPYSRPVDIGHCGHRVADGYATHALAQQLLDGLAAVLAGDRLKQPPPYVLDLARSMGQNLVEWGRRI
jgi:hypothetical protein